jgi:hypothetical protein
MIASAVLADSIPCRARAYGCGGTPLVGLVVIVLLALLFAFLVVQAGVRWDYGPVAWLLRWPRRRQAQRKKPNPFGSNY